MTEIIKFNPDNIPEAQLEKLAKDTAASEMPLRTPDGWFKGGKWKGKPALCRRVSVKVAAAPMNIPFFWSNLRIGKIIPAIEIVLIGYRKEKALIKGAHIKRTVPTFYKPFFIDNENDRGQKLVLEELTEHEDLEIRKLPGSEGKPFRIIYTNEVIVETVK